MNHGTIVWSNANDKTALGSLTGESPPALAPVPGLVTQESRANATLGDVYIVKELTLALNGGGFFVAFTTK